MRYPTTLKIVFFGIALFSFYGTDFSRLRAWKADAKKLGGDEYGVESIRASLKKDKQYEPLLTPFSHGSDPHTSKLTPLALTTPHEGTDRNLSRMLLSTLAFAGSSLRMPAEKKNLGSTHPGQYSLGYVGKETALFFRNCWYLCRQFSRGRCWFWRKPNRKTLKCRLGSFLGYGPTGTCCFNIHCYRTLRPSGQTRLRRWRRGVLELSREAGC